MKFRTSHTSLTACWAASLLVNVMKAYPLFVPVIGSIINLKSQILPHFSNSGISSSSYMSFGIFPQNTCLAFPKCCIKFLLQNMVAFFNLKKRIFLALFVEVDEGIRLFLINMQKVSKT